jgi:ElaB/YqjD/DUF883 family membrane-anchored ribosome-binding protein
METHFATLNSATEEPVTRQKLMNDLKVVVHDAEALMKATASDLGDKAREARVRLAATLESAKASCHKLEEKAVEGAKVADRVIRDNPYRSMGIALGVGVLVGLLLRRR